MSADMPLPKPLPLSGRGYSRIAYVFTKTNDKILHYLDFSFIFKSDWSPPTPGEGSGWGIL
jgi:hypothetical protein